MFMPKTTVEVAKGTVWSYWDVAHHSEMWTVPNALPGDPSTHNYRGNFTWSTEVETMLYQIHEDPVQRARHRFPIELHLGGSGIRFNYCDGGTSISATSGELSIRIPYEAVDGLVEALLKAKNQVPVAVAAAYAEYDQREKASLEMNQPRRKKRGSGTHTPT
jgi:hypothetical protein